MEVAGSLQRARTGLGSLAALIALILPAAVQGATLTVTDSGNAGPNSLRQALADSAPADEIEFNLPGPAPHTITLTGAALEIDRPVTITGPGSDQLTIDGNANDRVLDICFGQAVTGQNAVSISGVTITNGGVFGPDQHERGAGIRITDPASADDTCTVNLESVVVTNNVIDVFGEGGASARGAGISLGSGAFLTINNSTVSENSAVVGSQFSTATALGGGLDFAGDGGSLAITNSLFYANTVEAEFSAGSMSALGGGLSTPEGSLTNVTISGNGATSFDGPEVGGVQGSSVGGPELNSVTIANNEALQIGDSVTLQNTIVADPAFGPSCDTSGPSDPVSAGHNLDEDGSCGFAAAGDITGTDPALGALADNGGPTMTLALPKTSPAVDAGASDGLAGDQRGETRPSDHLDVANAAGGDGADIGAFELQAPAPPDPDPEPETETGICQGLETTILGTDGDDAIEGTEGDDVINSLGGADVVNGNGGDDVICLGPGEDIGHGNDGNDRIYGEEDDDEIYGDAGDDLLNGAMGNDALRGGEGSDRVFGGAGDDTLDGGADRDRVFGGSGGDEIVTGTGNDYAEGNKGADTLDLGAGNDHGRGGKGDDKILGGDGKDRGDGFTGNDKIKTEAGADTGHGGPGNDTLVGGPGDDKLGGGKGEDDLSGEGGDDELRGRAADDRLGGGAGDDQLYGGKGKDRCDGGPGNNTLKSCP